MYNTPAFNKHLYSYKLFVPCPVIIIYVNFVFIIIHYTASTTRLLDCNKKKIIYI